MEANKPADEKIFKEIDADSSGSITKEEMIQHWESRKGKHHREHGKNDEDKSDRK